MKGLIRKRSTTAARLQRAFSAKSLRTAASNPAAVVSVTPSGSSPGGSEMGADSSAVHSTPSNSTSLMTTPNNKTPNDKEKRQFIMETSVQFINVRISFNRQLTLKCFSINKSRIKIENILMSLPPLITSSFFLGFGLTGIAESRSSFVSI